MSRLSFFVYFTAPYSDGGDDISSLFLFLSLAHHPLPPLKSNQKIWHAVISPRQTIFMHPWGAKKLLLVIKICQT